MTDLVDQLVSSAVTFLLIQKGAVANQTIMEIVMIVLLTSISKLPKNTNSEGMIVPIKAT